MLGVHVTKDSHVLDDKTPAKTLPIAITRDLDELDLNCAQIFTYGPRFMVQNKIDAEEMIDATREINLSVHSAYSSTGIWAYTDGKTTKDKSRMDAIKLQLMSCVKLKAWGLVLHIGKIYPDEATAVMKKLRPVVKKTKIKLILEMVASKPDPDRTYETPEKIDNLTTLIGPAESWWGWCVDTAHIWAAGVNIRTYESMKKWLNDLTYKKKILMFHLNGSSAQLGCGKDKHEIVFGPDDLIWKGVDPKKSGVRAIVEFAEEHQIPIICEINRGLEKHVKAGLAAVKSLYKN